MSKQLAPPTVFLVAVAGIAVFASMDAVMKGLVLALGAYTPLLWRSFAGVILSGALFAANGPRWPARATLTVHLTRGLISAVMAVTFFWGLARVPMAQAVALTFVAPLLSIFLSAVILGERIRAAAVGASFVALIGIGVILLGQWQAELGHEALLGAVAVLVSAGCYAFNIVLMRRQAQVAGPAEVAFFQSVIVAIALSLGAPWFAGSVPDVTHAPAILLAAALATASLLLLAFAYARAPASYLAPSEYTAFLWAAMFGYALFGERLSPFTLAGAVLIVGGCLWAARARPLTANEETML